MTDRFRYLPCGLHEALARPLWASSVVAQGGPFVLDMVRQEVFVNLCHPAGWDHAVRAYMAIRGWSCPESRSVVFGEDPGNGWTATPLGTIVRGYVAYVDRQNRSPADYRESLCRCICAALGVDVGAVFPVEQKP